MGVFVSVVLLYFEPILNRVKILTCMVVSIKHKHTISNNQELLKTTRLDKLFSNLLVKKVISHPRKHKIRLRFLSVVTCEL